MKSKISQLNLHKYLPFLVSSINEGHVLAICNHLGKPLLSELSFENKKQAGFTLKQITDSIDWGEMAENSGYLCNKLGYIFFKALTFGPNKNTYWLLGFLQIEQRLSEQQFEIQFDRFKHIASCLTLDFEQLEKIVGMEDELFVRNEELNLLYSIDSIESFYDNNDEEKSLKRITNKCVDYLNIDYAAIYIPQYNFFFYRLGSNASIANENHLEQIIRQHLYGYVLNHAKTLVIDRGKNNEIDWTDTNLHIPNKLIAAPIFVANQKPCGLLVVINSLGSLGFSNSERKLTEVLAVEASKLIQVRRDPTTGQLNRRGFIERLKKTIITTLSTVNDCLLVIDLDFFKVVNNTAGREGGDQLLKQMTALILKNLKKVDIISRLGSDEFAIILRQCNLLEATEIAERIRLVIKQFRFVYKEKMFDLSACLGVVELSKEVKSFSQALSAADLACSVAKQQGRNRVHIYKPSDELLLKHENEIDWVNRINRALEQDLFQIYRQKIQSLQGGCANDEHYEILIRLVEIEGETLSPCHFIPIAERYNLMPKIDHWVVKTTLKKMADEFIRNPQSNLVCSINLSGQTFSEECFANYIQEQINKFSVPANRVCFEITETAAVSNLTQAVKFMEELKAFGCSFSLDDFGSGMSSFTYLKNLPIDYLKIDGYFVKTLMENKIDKAMVNAIHQIGSVMGLKTIAEFVENDQIKNELKNMGINYGQGYGIHKPEHFV